MREDWVEVPYKQVVKKISLTNKKLKQKEYLQEGSIPVIDQDIEKSDIVVPPKLEQKAIVTKIEQLFSELDNGIANLKTAQAKLKIYRQAVLKKAFEGELTKEWREKQTNLPTADELLEQIKKEREEHYKKQLEEWKQAVKGWEENGKDGKKPKVPKKTGEIPSMNIDVKIQKYDLPENWAWNKIGILCDVVRGGSPRPAGDKRFYDGTIPFLKVADITNIESIYLTTHTFTIKEAGLHKTRYLKSNTMLLSNSGATLGVPKILTFEATINDGIAAFIGLNPKRNLFLYYYLSSITKNLRQINQGAAQPNLNTDLIKVIDLPLCSLEEQTQIVQEIESRLSVCDKIEETIETSLEKSEALRQSILKKAFEGNLLSKQELENINNNPEYESAEALLERIKKEREK
jgi:type I restriction enzyme S subunit